MSGDRLTQLAPFRVATPWWQDTEPIAAVRPDLAVLRLLDARPLAGSTVGGSVTYLVEPLPDHLRDVGVGVVEGRPWRGALDDDARRMPWAAPGGPASDLDWARGRLRGARAARQHRTWNLSAIWHLETDDGVAWLKCLPPF